jgi:hypothetical protein
MANHDARQVLAVNTGKHGSALMDCTEGEVAVIKEIIGKNLLAL